MTSADFNSSLEVVVKTAGRLLTGMLGQKVQLAPLARLGGSDRSYVHRFHVLDGPSGGPSTVIVKQAAVAPDERFDPDAAEFPAPAWRLYNDWAALEFLTQVIGSPQVAPRFLVGERDAGLIIMEDLGSGSGIDALLLGDDPIAAEAGLIQLATLLGRMHARTIGKQAEFDKLRDSLAPRNKDTPYYTYQWLAEAFHRTVTTLGIVPVSGVEHDLETLIAAMRDPGPFLALTHGDPCPGNDVSNGKQMWLVDFEFGDYRHALTDGVYGRILFPTCWCVNRLPESVTSHMETAYRTALIKGCPAAANDTTFNHAVVEGCALWTLTLCDWTSWSDLLEEDSTWGIATMRQRVLARFEVFAETTMEFRHLEALGMTVKVMAEKLRGRWSAAPIALPYYPAFRRS